MPKKLEELEIIENSGVDHPAHLVEGWLVMKNLEDVLDVIQTTDSESNNDAGGNVEEMNDVPEAEEEAHEEEATEEEVAEEATDSLEVPVKEVVAASVDAPEVSEDSETLAKELVDLRKEAEEAKSLAKALMDERDTNAAIAKAEEWDYIPSVTPNEFGVTLKGLREVAPEIATVIEKMLDSVNALLKESELFSEIGTKGRGQVNDATSDLDMAAKALLADGQAKDYGDAVTKASLADPVSALRHREQIMGRG